MTDISKATRHQLHQLEGNAAAIRKELKTRDRAGLTDEESAIIESALEGLRFILASIRNPA